jgi:type VI secretion system protein ImpA
MPLPEGLLNPIPGENPSGKSLRYDPVYDKIREARREEEAGPLGELHEVKRADYPQVIKLATDALAMRSKDLQIAAWLTEAALVREHLVGLRQCLDLLKGLLEHFWDTVYPEIEDDDLEIRSAPLAWVGSKLGLTVRRLPLTKSKLDLLKYQESRQVGYEKDCEGNDAKTAARNTAIEEKKCTAEEFDAAVRETGDAYYEKLGVNVAATVESLQALEALSDEKFGREAPNFANLRAALEEMQDLVKHYYKPAVVESEASAEEQPGQDVPQEESVAAALSSGAAAAPASKRSATAEPVDREDAMQRVSAVASFLRRESPQNPVPYLLLRAARWGELRSAGATLDPAVLEPPPTEKRTYIKKMAMEGNWAEVLEGAESTMSLPCGRGWLDLQRYAVRACESLGSEYEPVAAAIRADLRALLADYPDLLNASLMDDTPVANLETQGWLKECILPPPPPPAEAAPPPEPESEPEPIRVAAPQSTNGEKTPDVVALAMKAARAGRVQEAIGMLTAEIGNERTGRGRFQRHIQLANIFLATKHEAIAFPILVELAEEIDRRKLEEWEDPVLVAQPLALLYRCSEKLGRSDAEREKIYQKLCRLDPAQALALR